jgi:hypothetical protein
VLEVALRIWRSTFPNQLQKRFLAKGCDRLMPKERRSSLAVWLHFQGSRQKYNEVT